MPLLVRLRPNLPYVMCMLIFGAVVAYGVARAGLLGVVIAVGGGVLLALFGYPVIVSTACRVPVLAVGDDGIRLPLMGVRLGWPEVSSVKRGADLRAQQSLLLIFPADPQAALSQVRPWLRRQARADRARYGTPIAVSDRSLDHSVDHIAAAIRRRQDLS